MRTSNGAASRTGRTSRRTVGLAVAGGAAAFVLVGGGVAMACPLPGHGTTHGIDAVTGWNHVSNTPGATGVGAGKRGGAPQPAPTPVQGQPGWNQVTNTSGTGVGAGKGGHGGPGGTGGQGGHGGQGGPGTLTAPGTGTPGGQGAPGWNIVSNQPVTAPTITPGPTTPPGPTTTPGQGAPGWNIVTNQPA